VTILFSVTVLLNFTSYASEDQFIYSVDSSPYNKTYQNHVQDWWKWYVSVPKTQSPNYPNYANHIKTSDCSVLQAPSNPVFYLFTPLTDMANVEWTCTIPKGKSILLPIVSASADFGDPTLPSKNDQSLVSTVKPGNDFAQIKVQLDGKTLGFNSDPKWRIITDFFNYTLPERNLWDDKELPGTYRAIAEGYNLFLKPLSTGEHLLKYEAATLPPNENQYAQTVTYHLIVK
jgi:hypothetical protein